MLQGQRTPDELAVTVCWVLAEPEARKPLWEGQALIEQLKIHNDLVQFGETLLNAKQIADGRTAAGMPSLADRARQADDHWVGRVAGLHPGDHLLSLRGLYISIYRLGSQPTHGSIASLAPYIEQQAARFQLRRISPEPVLLPYALISPLLAIALTIIATWLNAIDAERVRAINDEATAGGGLD